MRRVYSTPNTPYYITVTLPKLLLQLCTVYNPDSRAYVAVVTLDQWKLEGRQQGSEAENKSQHCAVATLRPLRHRGSARHSLRSLTGS